VSTATRNSMPNKVKAFLMRWPRLSERPKERLAGLATVFICAAIAVVLGQQSWRFLQAVWADHWIRKDAAPVTAIVTEVGPRRVLEYRYTVNGERTRERTAAIGGMRRTLR
jgi:hypothetical protein